MATTNRRRLSNQERGERRAADRERLHQAAQQLLTSSERALQPLRATREEVCAADIAAASASTQNVNDLPSGNSHSCRTRST
jgi:hypothetical protein